MKKLIIIFIILNLLDCITTYIGISNGLVEANLLLGYFMEYSVILGLAIKMLLAIVIVGLLKTFNKVKLLKAVNIAFCMIVVWNATMLLIF